MGAGNTIGRTSINTAGRPSLGTSALGLVLVLGTCASAECARAQLPLSIEELLVEDSVLKVSTQLSGFSAYQPVLGLREGDAGAPPRLLIEQRELQGSSRGLALRYGLTPRLELNALAEDSELRWRDPQGRGGYWERSRYALGASWLLHAEDRWPAVLLDATIDLYQRDSLLSRSDAFPGSANIGATVYRGIDPVVLSLAARYIDQRAGSTPNAAGSGSWLLAPQLNFSVNSQVTLIGGLTLRRQERSATSTGAGQLRSGLRLGLGYAPGPRHTLFLQADISTAGGESSGLSMEWLYQF